MESSKKPANTVLTITSTTVTTTPTIIKSFDDFKPLFDYIVKIFDTAVSIYVKAQHNKNTCQLLVQKIGEANSQVSILKTRKDLFTIDNFSYLQKLTNTLDLIKNFIDEISTYNKLRKYLEGESIKKAYEKLCKEYYDNANFLTLLVTINSQMDAQKENEMINQDQQDLEQFTSVLTSKDLGDVTINQLFSDVSEAKTFMDTLLDNKKTSQNQELIDSLFQEKSLEFNDYEQADDEPRSNKLRKYINIESRKEYAFKIVATRNDPDQIKNQIKNQVIILKQLKGCLNIAHFYGLAYNDGNFYLVTEWAENKNLHEYYRERKPDTESTIKIAFDVLKGLNFLNAVGIVHHDIRPHNIFITAYTEAKITNFELSRSKIEKSKDQEMNVQRARYNAPEILSRNKDNFKKYDTKCEVYSFGILLWEIAEKKVPYEESGDVLSIFNLVCNEKYRESFSSNSKFPQKYINLSTRATDQNPEERPNFTEILIEFNDIYNNSGKQSTVQVVQPSAYDWSYMTLDEAIEEHKKAESSGDDNTERDKLYKCFDNYANLNNIQAKYYKAYYINKGWSDLIDPEPKKSEIVMSLLKEAADHGDEFTEAQLRYGNMLIKKGGNEQGFKYLMKAANNGNSTAMFNVATWYHNNKDNASGNRFMTMAAIKGYPPAIKYCNQSKIPFSN